MSEITPDIVAQIASRIYNEGPHQSASSETDGRTWSDSAHRESIGDQVGPLPSTAAAPPRVGPTAPSSAATRGDSRPSFPQANGLDELPSHSGFSPSMLTYAPSVPSPPGVSGLPTEAPSHFPGSQSIPSFAGAPSPPGSSPDGLKAFVRTVRDSHLPGRGHPTSGSTANFREQLSVGKEIPESGPRAFDVTAIRKDFPVLHQLVNGRPLIWLDNAATTQKPQSVIDAISRFYENDNSNIHRAAHSLAARATDAYEQARQKVQTFLGASSSKEIVFVRGTTEGINLIAQTFGRKFLKPGDEIVMSTLEHHANIVPWQMIAKKRGAVIRVIPVNDNGEVMMEEYQRLLGPRTKVVSLTHASNSLGTILPIEEMTQIAKRYHARVLIDGAQSVAHLPVNMQQLGADFFVFSGHKIFGPTGIGAVYIKEELHDLIPPWQGGGNMIRNVTFEETTFAEAPNKFEAGTPNIADAIGLGAALDYVQRLGLPNIAAHEHSLLEYATAAMHKVKGLRLIGNAREKVGVLSFVLPNWRTEEVGRLLDQEGIAVRSGHHCSQPSLRRFGVETTVRPSLSLYNTRSEIDCLVDALRRIVRQ